MSDSFYKVREIAPGLFHIQEPSGVCCTLIVGKKKALLVDTGYGFANLPETIKQLTELPLQIINTHGHLDHAGGNYLFSQAAFLHPFEKAVYADYQRRKAYMLAYLDRRAASGKSVNPYPEDFDRESYLTYKKTSFLQPLNHQKFDLGGRTAEVIFMPGHTVGSLALFDCESATLIAGDNIGPSLWIMFDHSAPAEELYNVLSQIKRDYPIGQVLYSHSGTPYPPQIIDHLLRGLAHMSPKTSSIFVHPRDGYKAWHHKEPVSDIPGINVIHIVYPLSPP